MMHLFSRDTLHQPPLTPSLGCVHHEEESAPINLHLPDLCPTTITHTHAEQGRSLWHCLVRKVWRHQGTHSCCGTHTLKTHTHSKHTHTHSKHTHTQNTHTQTHFSVYPLNGAEIWITVLFSSPAPCVQSRGVTIPKIQ